MNPNKWMDREHGLYDGNKLNVEEAERLVTYILDYPYYNAFGRPTFEKFISKDRNKNIIMKTCINGDKWCR